jgi:hypothetical protein
MAQIQVRDQHGNGVPLCNIRIAEGSKRNDEAIYDVFTDLSGNTGWPIPFWPTKPYTLYVNTANVKPQFSSATVVVTTSDDVVIALEGL